MSTGGLEPIQVDPNDAKTNRVVAMVGYIIFLIPLLAAKDSPFAKYHANQSLVLLLTWLACNVVTRFIPILGGLLWVVIALGLFGLMIIGILNANNEQMKPLPIIGTITLIK